LMFE